MYFQTLFWIINWIKLTLISTSTVYHQPSMPQLFLSIKCISMKKMFDISYFVNFQTAKCFCHCSWTCGSVHCEGLIDLNSEPLTPNRRNLWTCVIFCTSVYTMGISEICPSLVHICPKDLEGTSVHLQPM